MNQRVVSMIFFDSMASTSIINLVSSVHGPLSGMTAQTVFWIAQNTYGWRIGERGIDFKWAMRFAELRMVKNNLGSRLCRILWYQNRRQAARWFLFLWLLQFSVVLCSSNAFHYSLVIGNGFWNSKDNNKRKDCRLGCQPKSSFSKLRNDSPLHTQLAQRLRSKCSINLLNRFLTQLS